MNIRPSFHMFLDNGQDCLAFDIRNDNRLDPALTLCHAKSRGFVLRPAPALSASLLAAKVRLVYFNIARQKITTFVKTTADQFAHAPSRLISNASLALNLFGRNAAASLSHQIDGVEPYSQGSVRLMEDCPGSGMNMMPAFLTAKGSARSHQMMLSNLAAVLAKDTIRPTIILKPFEARGIIGKFVLKVFNRVLVHATTYLDYLFYTVSIARYLPTVKG